MRAGWTGLAAAALAAGVALTAPAAGFDGLGADLENDPAAGVGETDPGRPAVDLDGPTLGDEDAGPDDPLGVDASHDPIDPGLVDPALDPGVPGGGDPDFAPALPGPAD